jgi:hypothetical protein
VASDESTSRRSKKSRHFEPARASKGPHTFRALPLNRARSLRTRRAPFEPPSVVQLRRSMNAARSRETHGTGWRVMGGATQPNRVSDNTRQTRRAGKPGSVQPRLLVPSCFLEDACPWHVQNKSKSMSIGKGRNTKISKKGASLSHFVSRPRRLSGRRLRSTSRYAVE